MDGWMMMDDGWMTSGQLSWFSQTQTCSSMLQFDCLPYECMVKINISLVT